jgi:hypothetical protein
LPPQNKGGLLTQKPRFDGAFLLKICCKNAEELPRNGLSALIAF